MYSPFKLKFKCTVPLKVSELKESMKYLEDKIKESDEAYKVQLQGNKVPNFDLAETWHPVSGLEPMHGLELSSPELLKYRFLFIKEKSNLRKT